MIISTKPKEEKTVLDLPDNKEFDDRFISYYHEAIEKALSIQIKKQETYNGNIVSYKDYLKFPNNYQALLYAKALRVLSIVNGSNVNYESLEDTYLDMINYAAFCYASDKIKGK